MRFTAAEDWGISGASLSVCIHSWLIHVVRLIHRSGPVYRRRAEDLYLKGQRLYKVSFCRGKCQAGDAIEMEAVVANCSY